MHRNHDRLANVRVQRFVALNGIAGCALGADERRLRVGAIDAPCRANAGAQRRNPFACNSRPGPRFESINKCGEL
jgi:hypothetical protein